MSEPTSAIAPVRVKVDRQAHHLEIEWPGNQTVHYPFTFLRANCPSAGERLARENPNPLAVLSKRPSAELADVRMVGTYAIAFTWADGHHAGIYSWEYLRSLNPPATQATQP